MTRTVRHRRPRTLGRLVAAAGALALALTACSSGSSSDDTGAATTAASTAASAAASSPAAESSAPDSAGTSAPASDTAGSDTGSAAPDTPASGSFTLGVNSYFLTHLMPGSSGGSNINNAIFTGLTALDVATGEPVMAVASSIESEDQKVWTITIKDDWTFHNGEPVTAQSFADSWNATADPKNAMTNNVEMAIFEGYTEMNPTEGDPKATELSGVEVVDDSTLKVTLAKPNALFPTLLTGTQFGPIPTEAAKDFAAFDLNPIGNGPFQVTGGGMTAGAQELKLAAYPDYAGDEKAKTAEITVKSYQDSTAIYTDFQAGALDLILTDGNDLASARGEFPDQIVDVAYPAVVTVGFPTWDDRFADPKVRQALSMAVDRQAIVDALLKGNGSAAKGLAPAVLPGGGQEDCPSCVYDVEKAKQLLSEGGGLSGPLTITTYTDPTNQAIIEAVANQWRTNLGLDVTPNTLPIDQLYKNFADKSLDGAFMVYSGTNVPHLYGLVNALFTTGSVLNVTGYSNDEVSDLLEQAQVSGSPEEFTTLVQQAAGVAMTDLQSAPLYHPTGGLLHTAKLSGVTPELLGGANLVKISVTE